MAAAGPAMEIVGRYSEVLDSRGEPVGIYHFYPWRVQQFRKRWQSKSTTGLSIPSMHETGSHCGGLGCTAASHRPSPELRWQALAASMDLEAVRDLIVGDKAVAYWFRSLCGQDHTRLRGHRRRTRARGQASTEGLAEMGEVLAASQYEGDDQFLWAAIKFLADRLPNSDPDSIAFHRVLRARGGIGHAAKNIAETAVVDRARQDAKDRQDSSSF